MFQLHGLHELVMCLYRQQRNTLHILARVESGMNVRTDNIRLTTCHPYPCNCKLLAHLRSTVTAQYICVYSLAACEHAYLMKTMYPRCCRLSVAAESIKRASKSSLPSVTDVLELSPTATKCEFKCQMSYCFSMLYSQAFVGDFVFEFAKQSTNC